MRGGYGVETYSSGAGDMFVSANGTPNMSVNVASGRAVIPGTQNTLLQAVYEALNDATVNLTISAADPTNPRNDIVVAAVQDAQYSGGSNQWLLQVVTGTPAGPPADPTLPANTITLARIRVNAGVTSITSGVITDLRPALANTALLLGQVVGAGGNGGGLGQFTNQSRFLGMLSIVGAPTSGTYLTGDWGFDVNNNVWVCTAGGSPGTWRASGEHLLSTLSGSLSTYDFTSIPNGYRTLELRCKLRDNSAATGAAFVDLTFNGDTGNNYNQQLAVFDATNVAAAEGLGRANIQATLSSGGGQAAGQYTTGVIEVNNYSDTNSRKAVIARIAQDGGDGTTATSTRLHTGRWRTTNTVVNRITLTPEQGTAFDANSWAELWGRP